jgi:membrane protease YdiL (CAAX protease family)
VNGITQPLRHYDHALHGIRPGVWRGVLAIGVIVVAFFGISTVLGGLALLLELTSGAVTPEQLERGTVPITPLVLLASNLSLALMIPISMGLQWVFFGVRPRWIWSVAGRLRWGWLGRLALVIVPVWALYVGAAFAVAPEGGFAFDGTALALIVVIVLTTPLQATGEEVGLRGLVQRSVGSWFARGRTAFLVSTVVSGILFGLAHFAADPWLIAYYVLFGAAMSIAAHFTGGLEAPILIHSVNNVLLLLVAAFAGQLDEGIDRGAGTGGPFMLLPIAVVLLGALLAVWWGRRTRVLVTAPTPPNHYTT